MESFVYNVPEIEADERRSLEKLIGRRLRDNEQLLIRVVTVGQALSDEDRARALDNMRHIARRAQEHAAAQGVTDAEVEAAVDEATEFVRHGTRPNRLDGNAHANRLLDVIAGCLTPDVARALVDARADADQQARIDELRAKARAGTLTSEEAAEYEDCVEAIDVISLLQAKARRFLNRSPGERNG